MLLRILCVLASILAIVALGLSLRGLESATPATVDLTPVTTRLDGIESRLSALESRSDKASLERPSSMDAPRVEPGAESKLEARMVELERRLTDFAARETRLQTGVAQTREAATSRPVVIDVAEMQRRARDAALTEKDRLLALGELRGKRDAANVDARLAVLDDVLALARASTDGSVRADVWRQLSGVTDARLKQPLLDALAFDTHASAREEAAETLAKFMPDAVVEQALRHAADHDAEERVRREALRSLSGGR